MVQSQTRAVSILIPTYNRANALRWCLEQLESQSFRNFQVIIADDGSSDDTPRVVAGYKAQSALDISYLRQENGGPAKARNLALLHAHAPVCLLIGDDILCTPEFVQTHYDFHQARPELAACGLGLTRWDEQRQRLTPFMKLFEQIQFGYASLESGTVPDWRHFYTSNLSLKTELLRRYPFDERFPYAAMEDIELGYRISLSENLRIEFLSRALAFHYHPTTLKQACRRSLGLGWSVRLLEEHWPETSKFVRSQSPAKNTLREIIAFAPLRIPLTSVCSWISRFYCNPALVKSLLAGHSLVGYRKRLRESAIAATNITQHG
jgi:glycosyltransferase involved in cell wall biosynthesis